MSDSTKQTPTKLDPTTLAIIFFYIQRLDGVLGKTHLQKLLFLTDLIGMRKFKTKFTNIEYVKNHYGPYSDKVDEYTTRLNEKNLIEVRVFPLSNTEGTYTRYYKKSSISPKDTLINKLGSEKVLILEEVVDSFGRLSLQEVLDVVYSLQTVKNSVKQTPLDVAKILENEDDDHTEFLDLIN